MCGLFAIVNHHKRLLDKRAFITLGCANDSRGGDACGIMIDGKVEKGTEGSDKYFQCWYSKSNLLNSTEKCFVALGHCRKASVGGIAADKAQPITIINKDGKLLFCVIHNGTIHNYKELAAKYIPDFKIDGLSDSQVMTQIFFQRGYDVLGEYEGGAAFIIQDYRINKTLIFKGESLGSMSAKTASVERPLYFVQTNKSVIFSSIDSILQGLYWGFTVYNVPSNVLIECDGKEIYEVKKYDRSKCYHCVRYSTPKIKTFDDFLEGSYYSGKSNLSTVDFDFSTGTYLDASTGTELHGVLYISDYGYISKYSTGYNNPYYFWNGIMLSGEKVYSELRNLQNAKVSDKELMQIAKRLSPNPTLTNKKYYTYKADNKRIPFNENYQLPLTELEIVCNSRGKLVTVFKNPCVEKFIPVDLTKEIIDKVVNYVRKSVQ